MAKNRSSVAAKREAGGHARSPQFMTQQSQGELVNRLWSLNLQLRGSRDPEKVFSAVLRLAMEFFGAAEGCVASIERGNDRCKVFLKAPANGSWDVGLVRELVRGGKVAVPPDLMFARIRRYGRMWGALFLRCPSAELNWDVRQAFSTVGATATDLLQRIDEARLREVRAKIDRKILEQIAPKDLFYQILHGLRSLIGYDHSAALLIRDETSSEFEIVAEQIAWQKAKSGNIGLKLPLSERMVQLLEADTVYEFDRQGDGWSIRMGKDAGDLAELLDYNPRGPSDEESTAENAILCAPLWTRRGVVGALKVAAIHPGTFREFEAKVISQFLSQASVAVENLRRTEALAARMQAAERELEEARQFQETMLPPAQAQFGGVAIAADYLPCNQLAGDFYDYVRADDGSTAVLIADVVGHGASAAMMTGIVKAAFHAAHQEHFAPLAVIDRLKYSLRAFDPGRFVTLICARIDANGRDLTYVNAGHPSAVLRRAGASPRLLEPTGPLVSSAMIDFPFAQTSLRLEDGDAVLFYTDGLTEARGARGMFGQERLLSLLEGSPGPGDEVVSGLLAGVSRFSAGVPLADDITVLVVEARAVGHGRT